MKTDIRHTNIGTMHEAVQFPQDIALTSTFTVARQLAALTTDDGVRIMVQVCTPDSMRGI